MTVKELRKIAGAEALHKALQDCVRDHAKVERRLRFKLAKARAKLAEARAELEVESGRGNASDQEVSDLRQQVIRLTRSQSIEGLDAVRQALAEAMKERDEARAETVRVGERLNKVLSERDEAMVSRGDALRERGLAIVERDEARGKIVEMAQQIQEQVQQGGSDSFVKQELADMTKHRDSLRTDLQATKTAAEQTIKALNETLDSEQMALRVARKERDAAEAESKRLANALDEAMEKQDRYLKSCAVTQVEKGQLKDELERVKGLLTPLQAQQVTARHVPILKCPAKSSDQHVCTLMAGHDGPHETPNEVWSSVGYSMSVDGRNKLAVVKSDMEDKESRAMTQREIADRDYPPRCRHGNKAVVVPVPGRPGWAQHKAEACGLCRLDDASVPFKVETESAT